MGASLSLAFVAGVLAAFNPCGLAMLPAYLGTFLDRRTTQAALSRALVVGAAVTVGFVIVFGTFGLLISLVAVRLGSWLSIVTALMGIALLVAGAVTIWRGSISLRLPRAKLSVSGSGWGMVSYGIVYATVSLSCTLPVFMAAVATSFDAGAHGSLLTGVVAFLAYALGMGLVLTTLALVVALFQERAAGRIRRVSPYFRHVSGGFLILAGLYVTWYGWVEYQSFQGRLITSGPTVWVAQASSAISQWLSAVPVAVFVLAAGLVFLAAARATRRPRRPRRSDEAAPSTLEDPTMPEDRPTRNLDSLAPDNRGQRSTETPTQQPTK